MIIRGPILNPRADGSVEYISDGVLEGEDRISFIGSYDTFISQPRWNTTTTEARAPEIRESRGIIIPAFLDAHIHIPQHPIRGRFTEGVEGDPPEGRLLAGLNRNVFPAEGMCADIHHAGETINAFLKDTLSQGVVGGAAYMTVHPAAAREALRILPDSWHIGLVLMDQNCPEYLRNNPTTIDRDLRALADEFGGRSIITDRFAVACSTELRRLGVAVAKDHSLRTQTHLNEQLQEKAFVEESLYPHSNSYTDVYRADGLLAHRAMLAHCVHMTDTEWRMLSDSDVAVMHCPTSNLLLGSGVMKLNEVKSLGIDYAICTDVGASPTTSMLMEMAQFVLVHRRSGAEASGLGCEALFRSTLAPARILSLERDLGSLEVGKRMSFVEVEVDDNGFADAEDAIVAGLFGRDDVSEETLEVIDLLAKNLQVSSAMLDRLDDETRRRAASFERRIIRVIHCGINMFVPRRE